LPKKPAPVADYPQLRLAWFCSSRQQFRLPSILTTLKSSNSITTKKADAPSGTAIQTAQMLAMAKPTTVLLLKKRKTTRSQRQRQMAFASTVFVYQD